jgi:hypothetical protein
MNDELGTAIDKVDEPRHLTGFSFFQAGWRPAFAWELLLECMALTVVLMHEVWSHDLETLSAIKEHHVFLEIYFSLRFAVIGVFGAGRTAEKVAAIKATMMGKL